MAPRRVIESISDTKSILAQSAGNTVWPSIPEPLGGGAKFADGRHLGSKFVDVVPRKGESWDVYSSNNFDTSGNIIQNPGASVEDLVRIIDKQLNIASVTDGGAQKLFTRSIDRYNRFKLANGNTSLQRGFPHVFFTRPDCNFLQANGSLTPDVAAIEDFQHEFEAYPRIFTELCQKVNSGSNRQFMFSLSNAAASFSTQDEYIETDSYGTGYTGYKIMYGKHDVASKTADKFSVTFNDDHDFHIYRLIRLWVNYIAKVYRGHVRPEETDIFFKNLDYASSVYYIVTAEDGETILFWTKFYGVFPTVVPSSQYGWTYGSTLNSDNTKLDVSFGYSSKRDYSTRAIREFNYNAKISKTNTNHAPIYDPRLGHVGNTWVGTPFIETISNPGSEYPVKYLLRYSPAEY